MATPRQQGAGQHVLTVESTEWLTSHLVRVNAFGESLADFGGSESARTLAVQGDGKIVAAGGGGPGTGFALARFLGGGSAPQPATADLSVTKSGPATVSIGDRATYTLTVTNHSATTTATGVSLADTLTGPARTGQPTVRAQSTIAVTARPWSAAGVPVGSWR